MTENGTPTKRRLTGKFTGSSGIPGAAKNPDPVPVPQVSTKFSAADVWGTWKSRWAMGRDDYSVPAGLYRVGEPTAESPVLVTSNYKMTFDSLRKELGGIDAWILVLDTKGVNVWCAAGKGTFGTKELVRRIQATGLSAHVSHRKLVLPQLGAVGVAAHEVKKASGFTVVYGPVRAADLPTYLAAGQVATPAMRRVRFTTLDRLVLTPAELVFTFKPAAIALGVLFILNAFGIGSYGLVDLYALAGTLVVGCVLTPVLLPLLPGRAFALKGAELGLLWAVAVAMLNGWPAAPTLAWPRALAYLLLLPALSAFLAMNFTGSTTFTSPSGVSREMRAAVPAMFVAAVAGVLLMLVDGFVQTFS